VYQVELWCSVAVVAAGCASDITKDDMMKKKQQIKTQ